MTVPDVPQASKDIFEVHCTRDREIYLREVGCCHRATNQIKGVTRGSRSQPRIKRGRHRSSSPTSSSDNNPGEQETLHTSKKSQPSRSSSLELFQPKLAKTFSKNDSKRKGKREHFPTSPVSSDLSSHSSSDIDSDSWKWSC